MRKEEKEDKKILLLENCLQILYPREWTTNDNNLGSNLLKVLQS